MDNITLESMLSVKSTVYVAKYWNSNMKISKRKESVSYDNVTDEVYTYIKNLVKNIY